MVKRHSLPAQRTFRGRPGHGGLLQEGNQGAFAGELAGAAVHQGRHGLDDATAGRIIDALLWLQ